MLGSKLMDETTQIGHDKYAFSEIIGFFVAHIKRTAELSLNSSLEHTVLGRPVYFVDDDPIADKRAEGELKEAFIQQGFKNVSFEFEPIAAARDYESRIDKEELVLIMDIGGGTSDFSLIRLSPQSRNKHDRTDDIIANSGIHIGGTDLDKQFSLAAVMPEMGRGSLTIDGRLMPPNDYSTLTTWHEINSLYQKKTRVEIAKLYNLSSRKDQVKRLVKTVEKQRGHELANAVELAKIYLSTNNAAEIDLDFIEDDWLINVTQPQLLSSISVQIQKVMEAAKNTVTLGAGMDVSQIKTVFMTGGSIGLPVFEQQVRTLFPNAKVIQGDRFASVATGLGMCAVQRYR
ncbi:MAG: putative chaperone protein [Paraglaciecola sp.]